VAGTVVGTYVHGLLTCAPLRRALLVAAARRRGVDADPRWGTNFGGDRYDRLADLVGGALDLDAIATLARCPLSAVAS
jgi:cobyric acid synthase